MLLLSHLLPCQGDLPPPLPTLHPFSQCYPFLLSLEQRLPAFCPSLGLQLAFLTQGYSLLDLGCSDPQRTESNPCSGWAAALWNGPGSEQREEPEVEFWMVQAMPGEHSLPFLPAWSPWQSPALGKDDMGILRFSDHFCFAPASPGWPARERGRSLHMWDN